MIEANSRQESKEMVLTKITRRDFLNGTQVAIGASLLSPWTDVFGASVADFSLGKDYYPPALTGLRGTHDGAWEAMHGVVAGKHWNAPAIDEDYDLIVVGGGISGLSAAYFYQQKNPGARILILENHDDFGGHAKRNEFSINGDTRIGYGGTESIDTPSAYAPQAKQLLVELGIDLDKFYEAFDQKLYPSYGLSKGILFDEKNFGQRKLVVGYGSLPWEEFVKKTPLNERAKSDLLRLQTSTEDYLPGLSVKEKIEKLQQTSYESFLREIAKVDPQLIELYRKWGISFWCVGIDEIPAMSVQSYDGMPGLEHTLPRIDHRGDDPYIFHFPDGCASIARLLVRALIPDAVPGKNQEDLVTARVDYSLLDRSDQATRIRLNSTAVNATHTADGKRVTVTYVNNGSSYAASARNCIMACYNSAIPYLCPELPDQQKAGLAYGVKVPLTYVKVLIPNWRAFVDLGLDFVYYTDDFYKQVELDFPVSLGKYQRSQTPDDPMILHMCYVHYARDIQGPEQWREGRRKLLQTPFSVFEHHVRDQLDQALSSAGFDADRDINAITVNRWPHGYAYDSHSMWEPHRESDEEKPWIRGRQQFGRIKIANSDAAATAYADAAIMEAWRAVNEIDS